MIMLDTHVVSFIYQKEFFKFGNTVMELIENEESVISPIVLLELKYLYDIKRINNNQNDIYELMNQEIGLRVDDVKFYDVINTSFDINWTRDPFDRLIVANAAYNQCKLITKDDRILANFELALW